MKLPAFACKVARENQNTGHVTILHNVWPPMTRPPPSVAEYRKQGARVVELHPMTMMQNARIWRDLACPLTRRNCGTIGNLEIRNGQYLAPRLA